MLRLQVTALLGGVVLILATVWALGAVVLRPPPLDLGPMIVVATGSPAATSVQHPSLTTSPRPSATVPVETVPSVVISPMTTPSPPRATEAIRVSKPPAPVAGDDADDDADDLDADADEDDIGDDSDGDD